MLLNDKTAAGWHARSPVASGNGRFCGRGHASKEINRTDTWMLWECGKSNSESFAVFKFPSPSDTEQRTGCLSPRASQTLTNEICTILSAKQIGKWLKPPSECSENLRNTYARKRALEGGRCRVVSFSCPGRCHGRARETFAPPAIGRLASS